MRSSEVLRGLQALREGALEDVADRYAAALEERHLAPRTVAHYLRATAHFVQWLEIDPRKTSSLPVHEKDVEKFLSVHLRQCRCPGRNLCSLADSRAALKHLVRVLQGHGSYFESPRRLPTPVDQEVDRFDRHLRDVCGVAEQTRLSRARYVREFLTFVFGQGTVRHEGIRPDSFGRFFAARARGCRPGTAGVITGGLRSYVRFLEFLGLCPAGLRDAVPHVARWRLASLPVHLQASELQRFLKAFDRRSARGRRDYAMALCLVVLGLRASEVATLRLSDIDWQAGSLTVAAGKTSRGRTLPLPPRVGHAIAASLRLRPRTRSDKLFVHIGVLQGEPVEATTVRSAVRLAYKRAGLPSSYTGTHLLRHTAATRLVASGASIKEVADVLGHASLDSTVLYAKVDLPRLRDVALPWPEEIR